MKKLLYIIPLAGIVALPLAFGGMNAFAKGWFSDGGHRGSFAHSVVDHVLELDAQQEEQFDKLLAAHDFARPQYDSVIFANMLALIKQPSVTEQEFEVINEQLKTTWDNYSNAIKTPLLDFHASLNEEQRAELNEFIEERQERRQRHTHKHKSRRDRNSQVDQSESLDN